MSVLFIVESPNKAKKIKQYFPDYTVIATVGHFRDLPEDRLGVEPPEHKPEYVTCKGKAMVEKSLRAGANKATKIVIATDPDREGEAIAGHVYQCIGAKHKTKMVRATYTEVNKKALTQAMQKARQIDWHLVKAQEGRRVVDRYVGYLVSPVLTNAFKKHHAQLGFLTCGRVQSVAAKLIVENHIARAQFKSTEHYGVTLTLTKHDIEFTAQWMPFYAPEDAHKHSHKNGINAPSSEDTDIDSGEAEDESSSEDEKASKLMTDLSVAKTVLDRTETVVVRSVQTKRAAIAPPKPLITISYVKLVGTRFKLTTKQAMSVAQSLFEAGLITYHRTDSPYMSEDFIDQVREYGHSHQFPVADKPRIYSAGANAQEAHECLRVTDISLTQANTGERMQDAIYEAIWLVTMQSQCANAIEDQTTVLFNNADNDTFGSKGVVEIDPGWRKTEAANPKKKTKCALPVLQETESLNVLNKQLDVKHTKPPALYTEKTLVAKLEKLGIGRPSTYGSILEKIIEQQYVDRDKKLTLTATELGVCVVQALDEYFNFMNYRYTAELEKLLDKIANRQISYLEIVQAVYQSLEHDIKDLGDSAWPPQLIQAIANLPARQRTKQSSAKKGKKPARKSTTGSSTQAKKQDNKTDSEKPTTTYRKPIPLSSVDEGSSCPECHQGKITVRRFKSGEYKDQPFVGCDRFPGCRYFQRIQ